MFNCVCHSHLPPPCLSKAEFLTQSTPSLFMVQLWSHRRSRSLSLMLSVNEVACIVPGAMKGRRGLRTELEGFSSSSAATLAFLPPCNRKPRSHAQFQLRLRFLGQRRKGGGVHRKTLSGSGLSFYCNLCKCCTLLYTPDIWLLCSGNMTAVIIAVLINCQPSTVLFLHTVSVIQYKIKKQCVDKTY